MNYSNISKIKTAEYVYELYEFQGFFKKQTETRRRLSKEVTEIYRNGLICKKEETSWYGEHGRFKKRCIFEYDEVGKEVKITEYNEDEQVSDIVRKEYDSHGNIVRYHSRSRIVNDFEITYRNEYDSKGNLILEYNIKEGKCTRYIYDNVGNIVESIFYDSNGLVRGGRKLNYDIEGNLISISENGKLLKSYHYNFEGLTDGVIIYGSDGSSKAYKYKYYMDSQRNWIKQEVFVDGVLVEESERKIYYN